MHVRVILHGADTHGRVANRHTTRTKTVARLAVRAKLADPAPTKEPGKAIIAHSFNSHHLALSDSDVPSNDK